MGKENEKVSQDNGCWERGSNDLTIVLKELGLGRCKKKNWGRFRIFLDYGNGQKVASSNALVRAVRLSFGSGMVYML